MAKEYFDIWGGIMDKRFLALFCIVIFSQHILAESFNKLAIYAEAFTSLGDDNNYIDSQIIDVTSFFPRKMQAKIIPEEATAQLRAAVANCVFMKKGAYGDHFKDDQILNMMIDKFHSELTYGYDWANPRQFFQIPHAQGGISSGIFASPCVLAIQEGNQVLMLQASATD
jgi:hypothetical protein